MASSVTTKRRAVLDSRQLDAMWTEWKSHRNELLEEFADGPARVSASVGIKRTEKIILASKDWGKGTDLFVSLDYSTSVSLNCPQTDEGVLHAKALASELAAEENLSWMEAMEPEILEHIKRRRFGENER